MSTSVLPISARKTGELARLLEERGYGDNDFQLLNTNPSRVTSLIDELRGERSSKPTDWLEKILAAEKEIHLAFFGQEFNLSFFRQVLEQYGKKKILEWKKLWLEPHFLPKMAFTIESNFPGWKVKQDPWFWQILSTGGLKVRKDGILVTITQVGFEGQVVLIDTRLKPAFVKGGQMYINPDFRKMMIN